MTLFPALARLVLTRFRWLFASGDSRDTEILALRHQVLVLQRQIARAQFTDTDRTILKGPDTHPPRNLRCLGPARAHLSGQLGGCNAGPVGPTSFPRPELVTRMSTRNLYVLHREEAPAVSRPSAVYLGGGSASAPTPRSRDAARA